MRITNVRQIRIATITGYRIFKNNYDEKIEIYFDSQSMIIETHYLLDGVFDKIDKYLEER